MNCEQIHERTIDFIYGDMNPEDRAAFDLHLAGCPACVSDVGSLSRTRDVARAALTGPLLQDAPGRVRAAVLEAARAARKPAAEGFAAWLRKPWFIPAFVTVGAFAVLLVSRTSMTDLESVMPRAQAPELVAAPEPAAPEPAKEAEAPNDDKTAQASKADEGLGAVGRGSAARMRGAPKPRASREQAEERWAAPPPARALARNEASEPAGPQKLALVEKKKSVAEVDVRAGFKGGAAGAGLASRDDEAARLGDVQTTSGARAAAPASARPAPAPASEAVSAPAEAAAKAEGAMVKDEAPTSLETLVQKTERAMIEGRWAEAVTGYSELLRRFPRHDKAPGWRPDIGEMPLRLVLVQMTPTGLFGPIGS